MSWKTTNQYNNVQQNNYRSAQPYYNGNERNEYYEPQYRPKPTNLSNSAVKTMLKENESTGKIKEVVWPPPPEDAELIEAFENDHSNSNSNQYHKPHHTYLIRKPTKPFSPPPTYIPLRASPPIMQSSPLVYRAEPIANTLQGGLRMRGDQRWPPPECKEQMEAEMRERMELAKGPLFRPKKVKKDYSSFFARNAIPNTYPGYKAPPGTQHYPDESDY